MAKFHVLLTELDRAGISLSVNTEAEMVDDAKGESTVGPSLGTVAHTALLRAQEQQRLDRGDGAVALAKLIEEHATCVFAEEHTTFVVVIEKFPRRRINSTPTNRVRQNSVHQRMGVVRTQGLQVT